MKVSTFGGALILAALAFASPARPDTLPPKPERQKYRYPVTARCVFVTDGDTIKVRIGGRVENVRLIGVNAPERLFRKGQ